MLNVSHPLWWEGKLLIAEFQGSKFRNVYPSGHIDCKPGGPCIKLYVLWFTLQIPIAWHGLWFIWNIIFITRFPLFAVSSRGVRSRLIREERPQLWAASSCDETSLKDRVKDCSRTDLSRNSGLEILQIKWNRASSINFYIHNPSVCVGKILVN